MLKTNYQKFKFEALKPFETQTKVEFNNNSYLIQVRIRNVSANKIFVENVKFASSVSQLLELVDLNEVIEANNNGQDAEGLFDDTVCFHQDEVRQYLYLLKPIKEHFRIDNSREHKLGVVNMTWRNYMGDQGMLELEQVKSSTGASQQRTEVKSKEIEIELVEPAKLVLEKPQKIKFKLHNLTKNYMRLQLSIVQDSSKQGDVLICGCYP